MARLVVSTGEDEKKGRSFGCYVAAMLFADGLWSLGGSRKPDQPERPIYAALMGTKAEIQAVVANLRSGRKASVAMGHKAMVVEFMKSAGYQYTRSLGESLSLATIFVPELFSYLGGQEDAVRFVVSPAHVDVDQLVTDASVAACARHLVAIGERDAAAELQRQPWRVGLAVMAMRHLAQRCGVPMPKDERFDVQCYVALRKAGWERGAVFAEPYGDITNRYFGGDGCTNGQRHTEFKGHAAPGFRQHLGCAFKGSQSGVREVLLTETKRFMEAV